MLLLTAAAAAAAACACVVDAGSTLRLNPESAAHGTQLDSKGSCCDTGVVDACGVCNGTGRAVDALGACCSAALDAQGVCCSSGVDECGVCNGTNSCDLQAELLAELPSAALYLIPNSNANRRLRSALQDALAAALTAVSGRRVFDKARLLVGLSAHLPPSTLTGSARGVGGAAAAASGAVQTNTLVVASQFNGAAFPQQLAASPWPYSNGNGGDHGSSSSSPAPATTQTLHYPEPAVVTAARPAAAATVLTAEAPDVALHASAASATAHAAVPLPVDPQSTFISSASTLQGSGQAPVQLDTLSYDPSVGANMQYSSLIAMSSSAGSGGGAVRQLQQAAQGTTPGSTVEAAPQHSSTPSLPPPSSTAAIVVSVVLHPTPGQPGPDTATLLLALRQLVGQAVVVPGSQSKLVVYKVLSVTRAGTCGDGVCQVSAEPQPKPCGREHSSMWQMRMCVHLPTPCPHIHA
jgi:hypothetical protein